MSELEDDSYGEKKKSSVGIHIFYIIIILLLGGALAYLFTQNKEVKQTLTICDTSKNNLVNEREMMIHSLDSIAEQLTMANSKNGELSSEIQAKLNEIESLKSRISSMRVNLDSLNSYRREIESVRKVAINYIRTIDSLGVANKQLTDKNNELASKVEEQQKVDIEKTKQLEDLSGKVERAAVLKAANLTITGINSKSKPINKAKKVVKLKASFTIVENAIIDPGQKMVYLRVVRADGVCLSSDENNTFKYDNQTILYTEKTEVDYQNKDLPVTIYYNTTDDLTSGLYTIDLFCEGKSLGQGQITFQ